MTEVKEEDNPQLNLDADDATQTGDVEVVSDTVPVKHKVVQETPDGLIVRTWRKPVHPVSQRDLMAHKSTMVILRTDKHIEQHRAKEDVLQTKHGAYVREVVGFFRATKPIPAGWVAVYVEGDPEPVTTREPVGYNSKSLLRLVGGKLAHAIEAANKSGNSIGGKGMLLIGGIAFVLAGIGYYAYTQGWFA